MSPSVLDTWVLSHLTITAKTDSDTAEVVRTSVVVRERLKNKLSRAATDSLLLVVSNQFGSRYCASWQKVRMGWFVPRQKSIAYASVCFSVGDCLVDSFSRKSTVTKEVHLCDPAKVSGFFSGEVFETNRKPTAAWCTAGTAWSRNRKLFLSVWEWSATSDALWLFRVCCEDTS